MEKEKIVNYIQNYIDIIKISPELFHDGIDAELLQLLEVVKNYIME